MPNVTIRRTWKVEGVLTDVTSAVLSDPTGTFGIKRNDTDAAVVADGTAVSNPATGVYEYTFAATAGLSYTAYFEIVYLGATYHLEHDIPTIPADTTAYATPADMIERYDARIIGDLVADDNTQVAAGSLPADAVLLKFLEDASGAIEAALLAGQRYAVADLTGLTGHAKEHLVRITCDLAMAYLLRRRAAYDPERAEAQHKLAERYLEQLRKGVNVFGLDEQIAAGVVEHVGLTTVDFQNLNLTRDRVLNYYPRRVLPGNR